MAQSKKIVVKKIITNKALKFVLRTGPHKMRAAS
jgi:hypothetical protein